ncbi:MAG: 23S rRNA (guanosine(2251)-2'-O)-methyltransferase RlmB [Clostridium sp.]|nr:23S rRNA (guanosine(2251)-2'-O)-methyltransferase RlmB [Prevotella sp.]MCM1428221.1 23S rRNA (guanosine(2251)-2'-O)-methyltransferase RlmB [Clostridium sp.]MCM1475951.1 23S rRNA (guanosine(2251)-2'-O)-methyltransferase RlmB [Muribaculaceae bacterium]
MDRKDYRNSKPEWHSPRGNRFRREPREKQDFVFGIRAVIEAIEAGKNIDKVFLRKEMGGELAKELMAKIREYGVVAQRVPVEKLNRITMKNHQGAIALMSPVEYQRIENIVPYLYEEGMVPFLLILDGITDTRNFGAIARTAECAGVDAIIIPERGSVSVTPEAVKASAGALFHVPVCRSASLVDSIRYLKESGYKIIGASEKGAVAYTEIDYTSPIAIVMGSEDIGISEEIIELCDSLGAIPIMGNIGSLNVSVAAGVMIYETVRQRLSDGMSLA